MKRNAKRFRFGALVALLSLLLAASGCGRATADGGSRAQPLTGSNLILDTFVTVTLYDCDDPEVLQGALDLCFSYEKVFSRTDPESEVYALNRSHGRPFEASEPVREVLETALSYSALTDGLYDVTICPLADLWDFKAADPAPPSKEALREAIGLVGWERVELGDDAVILHDGVQIDLGSIAKGYIADRMADYLREQGVGSAIINLGGNVLTVGGRPDGGDFSVGIQAPFEEQDELVGAVYVSDCSVVSSGVYERFFIHEGAVYHHILDPRTGQPARTGLNSVSVVCESSMHADALSTVLFLLGPADGLALADSLDGVEAIFLTENGEELYSEHFADSLGYRKDIA